MTARAVLLPGDGIGPEVVGAARRVVDAACGGAVEWEVHEVGGGPLPSSVVDAVRAAGVALKGPVTTPPDGSYRSVNLALRQELDLYLQVRRCRAVDGRVDVLVARETTEDLYAGIEWSGDDVGVTLKPVSGRAVRRAARALVAYLGGGAGGGDGGRRRVTIVHKATAMPATDGLFLRAARDELAAAGDAVEVDDVLVDVAAAELVKRPERFDVLFTGNLYGDILADLAGAVAGSVGLVPGANLGDGVAVFEPAHGSAPRHAGGGRVNPTAAVLSGALLLRHVGEAAAAARVESAVAEVLAAGRCVTYDVAPSGVAPVSTEAMTDAILSALAGR